MKAVLALFLAATAAAPQDHPRTYLLSVVGFPLKPGESVMSFSFETWGVRFTSVCKIPGGWWIEAGGSATPEGSLKGRGSLGATWFNRRSPSELRSMALVTLYGPVQRTDIGAVPATFKGQARINGMDNERTVRLTYRNIQLIPARRCPSS